MESTQWPPDRVTIEGRRYVAEDTLGSAPTPQRERLLTSRDIAERTSMSVRAVQTAMSAGHLAYTTPNGMSRPKLVRESEYERWIGLR